MGAVCWQQSLINQIQQGGLTHEPDIYTARRGVNRRDSYPGNPKAFKLYRCHISDHCRNIGPRVTLSEYDVSSGMTGRFANVWGIAPGEPCHVQLNSIHNLLIENQILDWHSCCKARKDMVDCPFGWLQLSHENRRTPMSSTMQKMLIRENKGAVRVASSLSSGGSPDIDGFSGLINVRTARFSPKEVIYHAGDQADKIYELRSGLVKLVTYMSSGRQRIVRLHGVNDCIGLAGLLRQSQEHTAVAVTPVEARFIQVGDYPLWNSHNGHHYRNLIEMLFRHLKKADIWIEQFATGCIRSRVAHLVNYLSEVEYGAGSRKVMLLTCEEMAAILGATTESVSTVLAEFKRSGALRLLGNAFEKQYELEPDLLAY